MKINWKVRLKNKTTWALLLAAVVTFIYTVCDVFGFVPSITESQITQIITLILNLLAALGVLVDPTTAGLSDSARAMTYDEPWVDVEENG